MKTDTITPVENEALLRRAVAQIEADPATWKQDKWVHYNCKTSFCLAGWTVVLSGLVTEKGVPTDAGLAFVGKYGLMRPYIDYSDSDSEGSPRDRWSYPYAAAAHILLGMDRLPGLGTHPIFDQYAAKPFDDEGPEERQEWADDDIEILKQTITRHTGVTFEELVAA